MQTQSPEVHARKARVAALSVASNSALVALKLTVGLLIGSVSVISEAIHSGVDLLASVIALVSVRTAAKPADSHHPFGHGKYENLSGAIEAILILAAAGWIIVEAIHKLVAPQPIERAGIGAALMLVSAAVNWAISRRLFTVGRETDSIALQADAWHLRIDVFTSVGVMAGLGIMWACQRLGLGWNVAWVDPVAALCVAILILKAAWDLTADSIRDLLDTRLPEEEERWIREQVARLQPEARSIHGMRTRKGGATRFVEFHLALPGRMTVHASHEISDAIQAMIAARYPATHVVIHVEPCQAPCRPACQSGCLIPPAGRAAAAGQSAAGAAG